MTARIHYLKEVAYAGFFETAPMFYLEERLVRKQLLEKLPPMSFEFSQMKGVKSFRELGDALGYTGDLLQAAKEIGERIIEHYADWFKDLILWHVRGECIYDLLRFSAF